MLHSDNRRQDAGFTLIELLVVILIIGILAAIAIPAFLHQRAKAQDADAKTAIVTAVKAMETYRTDHDSFDAASPAALEQIEPSLQQARNLTVSGSGDEYDVSVESASQGNGGGPFRVHRDADGRMDHLCDGDGRGACLPDGTW